MANTTTTRKRSAKADTAEHTLRISLFEPGMGPLHRVGLAGLWLTLQALDRDRQGDTAAAIKAQAQWHRSPREIAFTWTGDGQPFFAALLRYAYRFREDSGLMHFAALGDPLSSWPVSYAVHTAMLATFLQHPKSRKAETGDPTGVLNVEDESVPFKIRKVSNHAFTKEAFDPLVPQTVAGWLFPGGVVRHTGLGQSTSLTEAPGPMLALRFAPIGCLFFLIRQHSVGGPGRQQVSVVIPEVRDLEEYADLRGRVQAWRLPDLYTAGPGAAALRLLEEEQGTRQARDLATRRCRVITFGTVPWSSKQRTRVAVLEVGQVTPEAVRLFQRIRGVLPPRRVERKGNDEKSEEAGSWYDVPQVPELAAENLVADRRWWEGFAQFVADKERRNHVFQWEREGLQQMVKDSVVLPEGPELSFVRACHEAWRRRLGDLGERARSQGLMFSSLASREYEKSRVAFSRCKTAAEFRRTITDFWARGRQQQELQEHWMDVLPFLVDEQQWALGRDLALLALASYSRTEEQTEDDGGGATGNSAPLSDSE